jgi:uncharacterized membrane protein
MPYDTPVPGQPAEDGRARWRLMTRLGLGLFYGVAGLAHLVFADAFAAIVPRIVPYPREVVIVTGLCEIAGAIGLQFRRTRMASGALLALYAVCVWPANLRHAMAGTEAVEWAPGWWYHGPRLAAQPLLIWLALFAAGISASMRGWRVRGRRASAGTSVRP